MGQHKHNLTAIAAKEGKLPPKVPKWMEDELFQAMPKDLQRKVAMLTGTMAVLDFVTTGHYNTEEGHER